MKSKFLLLADYVVESKDSKLTIAGTFDTIFAPTAPARHGQMCIVGRLETQGSVPETHDLGITVRDADGHDVPGFPIGMKLTFLPAGVPGVLFAQFICNYSGLALPQFGAYKVAALIDGTQIDETTVRLVAMTPEQQQQIHLVDQGQRQPPVH